MLNASIPGAVLYVAKLDPWYYCGTTFKDGSVFCLKRDYKGKNAPEASNVFQMASHSMHFNYFSILV